MCIAISHPCSGRRRRRRRRPKQSNSNSLLRIHHQYHLLLLHTHTRGTDGGGIEGGRSPATAKGREQAAAAARETNRTLTSLPLLSHTLSPPSCGCCMNWTDGGGGPLLDVWRLLHTHTSQNEYVVWISFVRPVPFQNRAAVRDVAAAHVCEALSRSVLLLSLRAPLFFDSRHRTREREKALLCTRSQSRTHYFLIPPLPLLE